MAPFLKSVSGFDKHMKDQRMPFRKLLALHAVSCLYLALFPAVSAAQTGADVAVVVHPTVPVDDLSFTEVRKLLLGDRQFWNSDLRVTLLIRAPQAKERDVVLKTIYQMTEAQFRQYWIAKVFRAEVATGPKIVY